MRSSKVRLAAILLFAAVFSVVFVIVARAEAPTSAATGAMSGPSHVPGNMGDQITAAVNNLTKEISDHALQFLVAMAAIGTLSMAIIQAGKNLVPFLRWYQQYRVRKWLGDGLPEAFKLDEVEKDLIDLATAGDRKAFYDLPIEKLCGQMNAAAQAVLQYPEEHEGLFRRFASSSSVSQTDIALLLDSKQRLDLDVRLQKARESKEPMTDKDREATRNVADARSRVGNIVQRGIDGFQISAGYKWKWLLQLSAFALSAVIGAVAVYYGLSQRERPATWWDMFTTTWDNMTWENVLTMAVAAITAGFLAPVARDLVAAIEKLRKD